MVTLRYEDGTGAVYASSAEALAQAAHDAHINDRRAVDVVDGVYLTDDPGAPQRDIATEEKHKLLGRKEIGDAERAWKKERDDFRKARDLADGQGVTEDIT